MQRETIFGGDGAGGGGAVGIVCIVEDLTMEEWIDVSEILWDPIDIIGEEAEIIIDVSFNFFVIIIVIREAVLLTGRYSTPTTSTEDDASGTIAADEGIISSVDEFIT